MTFTKISIPGVYIIAPALSTDDRGFFARTFCRDEFTDHGLESNLYQCNISFNIHAHTIRGMHFQKEPFAEHKLVRCTMGSIFDVIVDLRKDSPTFKKWYSVELTSVNRLMLFIPTGIAHGFQTLENNTEVFYQMSVKYIPEAASGIRWNDPAIDIRWPHIPHIISEKDNQYPDFIT